MFVANLYSVTVLGYTSPHLYSVSVLGSKPILNPYSVTFLGFTSDP